MGSSCKRPLSIYSSLMVILTVIGYFGVSDADVVLRETESENGLVLNKLQPLQEQQEHPFRRFSINNDKNILSRNNKDAENESLTIDESMWDQIVIRALANPTEWFQLRQALDKVDADLRALTALENSKRNQSKSVPKWKFTYHRVMSPQIWNQNLTKRAPGALSMGGISVKKTKAFAAVSLATLPQHEQQQQSLPTSISTNMGTIGKGNNLNIKTENPFILKGTPKLSGTGTTFLLSPFLHHDYNKPSSKTGNQNQNHLNHNNGKTEGDGESEREKERSKTSPSFSEKQNNVSFKSTLNSNGNASWSERRSSRSRTQLEEEIAKMSSSSRTNDGSISTSFHWRPWIHHRNYNNKIQPTSSSPFSAFSPSNSPSPLSSTTASPPLSALNSPSVNDHHKNTWSEEMEKYHAQYHHHHPHNNHQHHSYQPLPHPHPILIQSPPSPSLSPIANDILVNVVELERVKVNQKESQDSENAIPMGLDDEDSFKEFDPQHHHQRHHQKHPHIPLSPFSSYASSSLDGGTSEAGDDQLFSTAHRISSLEYRI